MMVMVNLKLENIGGLIFYLCRQVVCNISIDADVWVRIYAES